MGIPNLASQEITDHKAGTELHTPQLGHREQRARLHLDGEDPFCLVCRNFLTGMAEKGIERPTGSGPLELRRCNKITIAKIAKEPILVHGDR